MEPVVERDPFQVPEAVAILELTPTVLHSLLGSLPDGWLYFQEDSEAWSPHTVLIHFIHNEQSNWIPRLKVLLSQEAVRRFAPFHQLPEQDERVEGSLPQLLDMFSQLRNESLSFLHGVNLGPAELEREAEHPSLGTVRLRNLLATWVVHDLNHLHQITKSLAKRYQVSVGPWRQYLGILDV